MTDTRLSVELVIQTATAVLGGRFAPREAVTILAAQTSVALPAARQLASAEPDRAAAYATIVRCLEVELDGRVPGSDQPHYLRAVTQDLAALARALAE